MAKQIQLRRGTEAENNAFTGALAELTADITNKSLRLHDGVTAGGIALVNSATNQTIAGIKTFTSSPIVPTPTTDMQIATKKYVDENTTAPQRALDAKVNLATLGNDVAADINAATAKTTPVDADKLGIWNSADGTLKSLSFSDLNNVVVQKFSIPSNGRTVMWVKIAELSNNIGTSSNNIQLLISGVGDFGNSKSGLSLLQASTREPITLRVSNILTPGASGITYGWVNNTSTGKIEYWIKLSAYNYPIEVSVLSSDKATYGNLLSQTTEPVGITYVNTTQFATNVLSTIAAASVGAVGAYAFLVPAVYLSAGVSPGDILAGSNLRYANASGSDSSSASSSANVALGSYTLIYQSGSMAYEYNCGGSPSGTWKALGYIPTSIQRSNVDINMSRATATLWLRIA